MSRSMFKYKPRPQQRARKPRSYLMRVRIWDMPTVTPDGVDILALDVWNREYQASSSVVSIPEKAADASSSS